MKQFKENYKPIKFPQDEQKHDHVIEWWYFNGNLQTVDGRNFSFMNTLFAAKPKQVKIPFLSSIPLKTLFFSHYLLTDNDRKLFNHKINPLCLLDSNSFTKPLLWVLYDNNCLIAETAAFSYHVVNDFIDLNFQSIKPPLLLNGNGFLDLDLKTTYYYSLTHLQTTGLIKVDNKWVTVSGLSWMDHQWAQGPLIRGDQWVWFSIQLASGDDLVCFVYGQEQKTYHASWQNKDGQARYTDQVFIKPTTTKYISKETGSEFQLGYALDFPDFDLQLEVKPYHEKQEMIFGTINYWEGGIAVNGILANKKVAGQGFMEIVGSPMKKSALNIYVNKFRQQLVNNPWKTISNGIAEKLKAYK